MLVLVLRQRRLSLDGIFTLERSADISCFGEGGDGGTGSYPARLLPPDTGFRAGRLEPNGVGYTVPTPLWAAKQSGFCGAAAIWQLRQKQRKWNAGGGKLPQGGEAKRGGP